MTKAEHGPVAFPVNTIARLGLYRRLVGELLAAGATQVFSHELAVLAVTTAAQVRRDLMTIGFSGTPRHGYATADLAAAIDAVLARSVETRAALVGVGNLGRAILAYYVNRQPVRFAAAFDRDPEKVNLVVHGCRCYRMSEMQDVVTREHIRVGVIAVPAGEAQSVADRLVLAGIRGILNFAPARLRLPPGLFVDHIDMAMALDRVAFYAHPQTEREHKER